MQDFFQQGIEEFIHHERDLTGKKTRHQKKEEKIQKLKRDLEDPEQRRKRHEQRRKQDKKKLKSQFVGLSQQEINGMLREKEKARLESRQRIFRAIKQGQLIFIDVAYERKMNEKENKSLALQIELITKVIKHIQNPPGIHLCSVGGVVEKQLEKMGHKYWTLASHTEDVVEMGKRLNKKLVYLSPDVEEPLQEVRDDTAYIIGGLVDRTVIKNASRDRANELGIVVRTLPIREMMRNRACLNLDHVVMMLWKFKHCGNWEQTFEFGAPKRWKRSERQQGATTKRERVKKARDKNSDYRKEEHKEKKDQNSSQQEKPDLGDHISQQQKKRADRKIIAG